MKLDHLPVDRILGLSRIAQRWIFGAEEYLPGIIRKEKDVKKKKILTDLFVREEMENEKMSYGVTTDNIYYSKGLDVMEYERNFFNASYCETLDRELGFLAGYGEKYSIEKVAEVLSVISDKEVTKDNVLQMGESGKLSVHKKTQYQGEGKSRRFKIHSYRERTSDRFVDDLAWVEYDDLCKFVNCYEKGVNVDTNTNTYLSDKWVINYEKETKKNTLNKRIHCINKIVIEEHGCIRTYRAGIGSVITKKKIYDRCLSGYGEYFRTVSWESFDTEVWQPWNNWRKREYDIEIK